MNRTFSLFFGLLLVGFGVLALSCNLSFVPFAPWLVVQAASRLWPFLVLAAGILFVLPAIVGNRRALGGLWIPGMPLLMTGALLLFTNFTGWWRGWGMLWPLEVLALGLGFLLAGIALRVVWLLLPAILIGINGLALLFCSVTGLWQAWAVLWVVEPLGVGLSFMLISAFKRSTPLFVTGMLLSGMAGVVFLGMLGLLGVFHALPLDWRYVRALGALGVVGLGGLLIGLSVLRPRQSVLPG